MQVITKILADSIAEELNIEPGSKLLRVNGEEIGDIFDYEFLIADDYVELEIERPDGEVDLYPIEKDEDEEMGLVFENSLMDQYRRCSNNCIFCFIDQMPPGMRETLYFKDDDSRLSFLQGNYITLTNMKDRDIDRIIRYHMSPINISVHTTNPELRQRMLHNRFAGEVLKYLDRLYEAEIRMNGQIVLCKGVNDGEELERTIRDLGRYAPVMESVSIVPVGLTRYREGLYPLEPLEREDAVRVIDLVERFQKEFYGTCGLHVIHASDELYLLAGRELPEAERYDGYLQLENGVGMLRLLREEFREALAARTFGGAGAGQELRTDPRRKSHTDRTADSQPAGKDNARRLSIATGMLAHETIRDLLLQGQTSFRAAGREHEWPGVQIFPIRNDFFGERITVSGLICGCDLIRQLKGKDLGEELLLPINMMRAGEQYFLDDITVSMLEQELQIKVTIVPSDGESLLRAILGEKLITGGRQIYEQADRGHRGKA
ncbi:MAG: DUF512 domain-containing protein [Parasporobacterium sp.]|nr:DUF512 domain-containing protein [Parasporobacterium sp.]